MHSIDVERDPYFEPGAMPARPAYPNAGRWGGTTQTVAQPEETAAPVAAADVTVPVEVPLVTSAGATLSTLGSPVPRRPILMAPTRCGYCGQNAADDVIPHIPGCAYELPAGRREFDAAALRAMVSSRGRPADPALVPTRYHRCGWCKTPEDPDRGPDAQHTPTCGRRAPDRVNGPTGALPRVGW